MSNHSVSTAAAGPAPNINQTPNLSAATQAYEDQQYHTAAQLCSQLLKQDPANFEASFLLAKILLEAEKPEAAVQVLQKAVALVKVTRFEIGCDSSAQAELLQQLGMCQTAAGQYKDAVESFQRASVLMSAEDPTQSSLQALIATALYPQGGIHTEAARSLVENVLHQDPNCQPALVLYAHMAADEGNWPETAKISLRLLAHQPTDKHIQQLLIRAAQHPAGMKQLLTDTCCYEATAAGSSTRNTGSTQNQHNPADSHTTAAIAAPTATAQTEAGAAGATATAKTIAQATTIKTTAAVAGATATSKTAAALSFIAATIQPHGAMLTALDFYSKAVQLQPQCGTYALGWVQALELEYKYAEALDVVTKYCAANSEVHIGCLSLKDAHRILIKCQSPQTGANATPHGWIHHQGGFAANDIHQQCQNNSYSTAAGTAAAAAAAPTACGVPANRCTGSKLAGLQRGLLHISSNSSSSSSSSFVSSNAGSITEIGSSGSSSSQLANQVFSYDRQDLDILALLLTAVKVLFCGGDLAAAAELLLLCNAAAAAAATPLHRTHIRNEAAYAECITQLVFCCGSCQYPIELVAFRPSAEAAAAAAAGLVAPVSAARAPPAAAGAAAGPEAAAAAGGPAPAPAAAAAGTLHAAAADVVYLCGDSHCLPGAWRVISIRGRPRLLRPLLVTGLKIWHLRDNSTFCTKHQFWNAIRSIQRGSNVVMVAGEIDCRKGLMAAVDKMKYSSLQQAIEATVNVYVSVLCKVVTEHKLTVFVHPVPPVLDATREVVLQFEAALKLGIESIQDNLLVQQTLEAQSPSAKGHKAKLRLHYLDFGACLLDGDGRLIREFELDGTHLHPKYLMHLEAALSAAVDTETM